MQQLLIRRTNSFHPWLRTCNVNDNPPTCFGHQKQTKFACSSEFLFLPSLVLLSLSPFLPFSLSSLSLTVCVLYKKICEFQFCLFSFFSLRPVCAHPPRSMSRALCQRGTGNSEALSRYLSLSFCALLLSSHLT